MRAPTRATAACAGAMGAARSPAPRIRRMSTPLALRRRATRVKSPRRVPQPRHPRCPRPRRRHRRCHRRPSPRRHRRLCHRHSRAVTARAAPMRAPTRAIAACAEALEAARSPAPRIRRMSTPLVLRRRATRVKSPRQHLRRPRRRRPRRPRSRHRHSRAMTARAPTRAPTRAIAACAEALEAARSPAPLTRRMSRALVLRRHATRAKG